MHGWMKAIRALIAAAAAAAFQLVFDASSAVLLLRLILCNSC
jgi:hypothetical protein